MDALEIEAMVDELPEQIVDYLVELQDENETLKKSLELETEVDGDIAIEKAMSALPDEMVALWKADRKRLAEAETSLAKQRDDALHAVYVAKAREFPKIVDDVDAFATVLADVAKGIGSEAVDTITKTLKTASERLESADLFAELGKGAPVVTDTEGRIEQIAKSLKEADPTMDDASARALAWERNPELYAMYVNERRQSA